MRINFVLLPAPKITGGPLAILEYAERLQQRGHEVSITTSPPFSWNGADSPFPWFKFTGELHYDGRKCASSRVGGATDFLRRLRRSGPALLRNLRSLGGCATWPPGPTAACSKSGPAT